MALKKCRECGKEVSTQAKVCPNCGIKNPAPGMAQNLAGIVTIAIFAWLGWVIFGPSTPTDKSRSTSAPADQPASSSVSTSSATTESGCKSDYHACINNADLVEHNNQIIPAQVDCKMATNEHVKYGDPDWPWLSFGSYLVGNDYPKTGLLVLIEKDVKIQNAFSAMVHSVVRCMYDLNAKKVIALTINDEQLILGLPSQIPPENSATSAPASRATPKLPAPGVPHVPPPGSAPGY